jgi:hypothetical protein
MKFKYQGLQKKVVWAKDTAVQHYDEDLDKCVFVDGETPTLWVLKPLTFPAKVLVERAIGEMQKRLRRRGKGKDPEFVPRDGDDLTLFEPLMLAFRYGVAAVENLEMDDEPFELGHQGDGGLDAQTMEILMAVVPEAVLEIGALVWRQTRLTDARKN